MRRALHAEWTKLRTARSTAMLPLVAALTTAGLPPFSGVYLGQIAVVTLAVLTMAGEYHTGLISITVTAIPSRLTVYAAKATILTAVVLPAALLGVAGSLLAGAPFPSDHGPNLRAAAGTVLYLGLVALLSFGLAAALRDTVQALTAILALLYLTPLLARMVADDLEQYAPMTAGLAIQATRNLDALPIGPWAGLGVLAGYAGAALALGATLFTRGDLVGRRA